MKVTAETITDDQIAMLRRRGERMMSDAVLTGSDRGPAFHILLVTSNALHRNLDTSDGRGTWSHWRLQCAEAWNAPPRSQAMRQPTYDQLFRVGDIVEVAQAPKDGESEPQWLAGRVIKITTRLHVSHGGPFHMAYERADYNKGLIRKKVKP